MSQPEKKARRSGRESKKDDKPKKEPHAHMFASSSETAIEDDPQRLHSPWLPLIWMLIPLIACVVYGLMTRNTAH